MSTTRPVLRRGSGIKDKSPEVVAAVEELQDLLGISPEDGMFGGDTETEVKEFQRENGLVDDGVVGRNSWKRLLLLQEADEEELDDLLELELLDEPTSTS